MKVSNLNIPVSEKNDPTIEPQNFGAIKTSELHGVSDPFVLLYGDRYYLYELNGEKGVVCIVSEDLENWSKKITVFSPPKDFHGVGCWFWAPECHYYKGNFYLFTSVMSAKCNKHRVISVYKANNPLGPFEDIANGVITPPEWDAIDGTLFVDDEGKPWMVFVHEWTSMPDGNGAMSIARLSEDFTHFITEPKDIFHAKDPVWAVNGVTDGPYLYRTDEGELLMTWSTYSNKGYVIALARSKNGKIDGEWEHFDTLVYEKGLREDFIHDGGHPMIFKSKEGKLMMAMHGPVNGQEGEYKHLKFYEIEEKNGAIRIKE